MALKKTIKKVQTTRFLIGCAKNENKAVKTSYEVYNFNSYKIQGINKKLLNSLFVSFAKKNEIYSPKEIDTNTNKMENDKKI